MLSSRGPLLDFFFAAPPIPFPFASVPKLVVVVLAKAPPSWCCLRLSQTLAWDLCRSRSHVASLILPTVVFTSSQSAAIALDRLSCLALLRCADGSWEVDEMKRLPFFGASAF